MKIPFNKPSLVGRELEYIKRAIKYRHVSGNGQFTRMCHDFFEKRYGFKKTLLTTSCTDALEMAAILLDIQPGDEVIVPSYTFVSTANAFILRGAKIVFADSEENTPNLDADKLEKLITPKTKAIVPVHYAGVACDMDKIMALAGKYQLYVVEDAAQAIDSYYKGKPLGSIGHLAAFSFHETKNIISGEGGMLIVNDDQFIKRSEIIWEKGTNRTEFFRGEVDKYGWLDIGSSFLPSDIIAAFLYAQLEELETIQSKRISVWDQYYKALYPLQQKNLLKLPNIPSYATNNAHMFYIICNSPEERDRLLDFLKKRRVNAIFHYLPLHNSKYFKKYHDKRKLKQSIYYTNHLVRLPFYLGLTTIEIKYIIQSISAYYQEGISRNYSVV